MPQRTTFEVTRFSPDGIAFIRRVLIISCSTQITRFKYRFISTFMILEQVVRKSGVLQCQSAAMLQSLVVARFIGRISKGFCCRKRPINGATMFLSDAER
jgi:hypothetical protein